MKFRKKKTALISLLAPTVWKLSIFIAFWELLPSSSGCASKDGQTRPTNGTHALDLATMSGTGVAARGGRCPALGSFRRRWCSHQMQQSPPDGSPSASTIVTELQVAINLFGQLDVSHSLGCWGVKDKLMVREVPACNDANAQSSHLPRPPTPPFPYYHQTLPNQTLFVLWFLYPPPPLSDVTLLTTDPTSRVW